MIEQLKGNIQKSFFSKRKWDVQKSVDAGVSKNFKSLFVIYNNFDGSEDFMVLGGVFNLVGEAMVEFIEILLETTPSKTIKELMRMITQPKGVKTAKPSRKGPEYLSLEI